MPLVAILLVLSAWPNAMSGHSFAGPTILTDTFGEPVPASLATGWTCYAPPC